MSDRDRQPLPEVDSDVRCDIDQPSECSDDQGDSPDRPTDGGKSPTPPPTDSAERPKP